MARPYFSTWQRDRTRGALQEVPQPLPANARPDRLMSVRLFSAPQALKRAVQQLPHSIPSRYPRRAPLRRRLYPLLYRRREITHGAIIPCVFAFCFLSSGVLSCSRLSLEFGQEIHDIEGVPTRVFSIAKTVADCFKYRNKIGLDVAIEALRECLRDRKATMDDLWQAAKVCRVANVIKPYLEALA